MSKCILCAKCIRGDQDLVVEGVLDFYDRGFRCRSSTLFNQPLEKSDLSLLRDMSFTVPHRGPHRGGAALAGNGEGGVPDRLSSLRLRLFCRTGICR